MTDMNIVILSGRVTKTPELLKKGDLSILEFSIAVNKSYKKKETDEWENQVTFVTMAIYGDKAERFNGKLKKGNFTQIQGRLYQDVWEKEGKRFSQLKVIPDKIYVISSGKDELKENAEAIKQAFDAPTVSIENGWIPKNQEVIENEMDIF